MELQDKILIRKARSFAKHHFEVIDHRRKYTHEPYIVHPASVAKLVQSVPHTTEMVCAAWLHDTVEDTPVTIEQITIEFGIEISYLVYMLTDVSRKSDGNREVRKRLDREHIAQASPQAKTIKLADLIDNSRSIIVHNPGFAKVYLQEKEQLLQVLTEGDRILWKLAHEILIAGKQTLALT